MMKTVDLTPPVAQMITYNGSTGEINIRLQPRETMNPNFVPPYDANDPEKYLVIPVDGSGTPQIPPDCADESTYWRVPTGRQDILIRASNNSGCEGMGVNGTNSNNYYYSCANVGGTLSGTICVDGNGTKIGDAQVIDNWVTTCPSGNAPQGGVCQETNGIPPEAACGAAAAAASAGASCDTVTITPQGPNCGKIQYAVLDRPNMFYPPSSTATTYPISGRTALMTSTNGTLYTLGSTDFFLQSTAPQLTFNDGGHIKLNNGDTLIMNPPAIIAAGAGSVKLVKGGQLVSSGGTQKQAFGDNATAGIPNNGTVVVHTGRSVELAPGYLYPTAPKVGNDVPYARLPVDEPTKEP